MDAAVAAEDERGREGVEIQRLRHLVRELFRLARKEHGVVTLGRSFRDAIEILAAKVNLAIDNHHRSIEVVVQRIGRKDSLLGTAFQHDRRSLTAGDINTASSADRRREDVVQGSESLLIMTLVARGIDDR